MAINKIYFSKERSIRNSRIEKSSSNYTISIEKIAVIILSSDRKQDFIISIVETVESMVFITINELFIPKVNGIKLDSLEPEKMADITVILSEPSS